MLIERSGQVPFPRNRELYGEWCVCGGEGIQTNARILFIQDGSERREVSTWCLCLKGVC